MMELVVVVLILSVLGGALVPKITGRMASAVETRSRLSDMRAIRDAIEQYHLNEGVFPTLRRRTEASADGTFRTTGTSSPS